MDLDTFCREIPKIELHAHLNGSLSRSTMLHLQRYLADMGVKDKCNAFLDEFQMSSGDSKSLPDVFPLFTIAHELTSFPETLSIATAMTLREFEDDGCCYIELRSTPKETPHMTRKQYIDTIVQTMKNNNSSIIPCLIISINRASPQNEVELIVELAIEYHKKYPDLVITLHCGEISNPQEVLDMLKFKPERIGHGVCIHSKYGGNEATWQLLCKSQIPVEVCLTSNVNTKSTPSYSAHHFKELYNANVPIIICTDDKGIFATSLSQEYRICAETFGIEPSRLVRLSLRACDFIFSEDKRKTLSDKILNFINKNGL